MLDKSFLNHIGDKMKLLNYLLLIIITININLFSNTNSHENINSKKGFVEESKLAIKSSNSTNRVYQSQFNQNSLIINERLKKRGVVYRLNNESTRGDCEFFDCSGQEACGFESWLGDGICDDGEYGIFYNCDEFDNDNGDCEAAGDDGGGEESVQLSIGETVGLQGEMPGEGILYGSHVPL